jgi:hypothetical protein
MRPLDEFREFAREVERDGQDTRTELMTFPSGAAMLDIWRGGRFFVMAYFPSYDQFCVDEVLDQDDDEFGIATAYRYGFKDFEAAKQKLQTLMAK